MFLQVDSVVRDSPEDLYHIKTTNIQTEFIKDFRPWHRGKSLDYQGIEGDMTMVMMERVINPEYAPHKWYVIINEKDSDFRDRLNTLKATIPCPTVQNLNNQ